MYLYLFLFLFCFVVNSINADTSLDSDIASLPSAVKKQLYDRIARRIFNEVKSKQLANKTEVLVTKEQLQQQDEFVKKLISEEQKKLRKSNGNDLLKNDTEQDLEKTKDSNDPIKPTEPQPVTKLVAEEKIEGNKKNELVGNEADKKDLRNENQQTGTMGFIDMTKRSFRRNLEPESEDSAIGKMQPNAAENKNETSTIEITELVPVTEKKPEEGIVSPVIVKIEPSINENTNMNPLIGENDKIKGTNVKNITVSESSSYVEQEVTTNGISVSTASSLKDYSTDTNKVETMIQIESLSNNKKNDTQEDIHQFRTKNLEGDHVVKYVNISLLRSQDKDESLTNSTKPEQQIMNNTKKDKKEVEIPEVREVIFKDVTNVSSTDFKATTNSNDNNKAVTEKGYTTMPIIEVSEKIKNVKTMNAQKENSGTEIKSLTEITSKNITNVTGIDTKKKRSNNKNISININLDPKWKNIEATTTLNTNITISKLEENLPSSPGETKKQFDVNLTVALGEQNSYVNDGVSKNTNLNVQINKRQEITKNKPLTTTALEIKTNVTKEVYLFTPSFKKVLFDIVTPAINKLKVEKSSKLVTGTIFNKKSEPYFVFEAPPEESVFKPVIEKPTSIEATNIVEPAMVPVHNYDPENAYYNPNKYYELGSNEKEPIQGQANNNNNKFTKHKIRADVAAGNKSDILLPAKNTKYMEGSSREGTYIFESPIAAEANNYEQPKLVTVHSYDPSNAYYNSNKPYGTGSVEKSPLQIYSQDPKQSAVKNKKLFDVDVATGNSNDIIFQNLNLKIRQDSKENQRPSEFVSDDGYILNFLKKKHITPKKILFKAPQEKNKKLFKDNADDEFIVIKDIIAQNTRSKKKKREEKMNKNINFILDILFNTESKLKIPKRQKKSTHDASEFNQFLDEYLKDLDYKPKFESSEESRSEFIVLPAKLKNTKRSSQQEREFLAGALKEIFEKPSIAKKSKQKKRSPNIKKYLRDDDIALDYYFERDSNDYKVYDESVPIYTEDKNEIAELPIWLDSNELEKSNEKVFRNEKSENSKASLISTKLKKYLNQERKTKNSNEKSEIPLTFETLKEYLNHKTKTKKSYGKLETSETPLKFEKLKDYLYLETKTVNSDENEKGSACAAKDDVNSYLNVLEGMIDGNSDALENFDWLGTTVDTEASLQKLQELSQNYLNEEELKPKDYQLFKFFVYLHKMSDEKVKSRQKCAEEAPKDVYRYEENGDELIIAPREITMKMKKDKSVDPMKLFNDYFFYLFKIKRSGAYAEEERADIEHLYDFVTAIKDNLYELHMAIKNIAMVTEYSSQNWYRDLKNVFLKSAKRKQLLSVLLHITFIRVMDMVEVAILDGIDKNYVKFIIDHEDDFEKILEKTEFIQAIMIELVSNNG